MMRIFIFFIFSIGIYAQNSTDTKFDKLCNNVEKIGAVAGPWLTTTYNTITITPAGPITGVAFSQFQNRSPFLEFCALYQRMKTLESKEKIFAMAEFANKATNNRWNKHLDFARSTDDIFETVLEISSSKDPKAGFLATNFHRKLSRYTSEATEYSNSTFNTNLEFFKSRSEKTRTMRRLVRTSKQVAIINDRLRCNKNERPNNDDKINYQKDIEDNSILFEEAKADVDYIFSQFENMSYEFFTSEGPMKKYLQELYNLRASGVKYKSELRITKKKTNKVKDKEEEVDYHYQVFSTTKHVELFNRFKEQYNPYWQGVVNVNSVARTRGLLDSPGLRYENRFRDLRFECRSHKFKYELITGKHKNTPRDNPELLAEIEQKVKNCKEGKMGKGEKKDLFSFYVDEFYKSLSKMKDLQAQIWSVESFYFGTMRNVENTNVVKGDLVIPSEQVVCSEKLNMAQLKQVQARALSLNLEMREELLNLYFEKTTSMKAQREKEKLLEKERIRRRKLEDERIRRSKQDYSDYVTFPELNRGF
ncbi:MAG: hypothetical protein GY909_16230 [Oligoflexia bacterium]|nr:hypothetical protein [Oligoflexia bacterium]